MIGNDGEASSLNSAMRSKPPLSSCSEISPSKKAYGELVEALLDILDMTTHLGRTSRMAGLENRENE